MSPPPKKTRHTALCRLFAIYVAPVYPDQVAAANRYIPNCRPQSRSEMPSQPYKSKGDAPELISATAESGLTTHSAPLRRPAASQRIGCCPDRMKVCIDKPNARLWAKLPKKRRARAQHLNQIFLIQLDQDEARRRRTQPQPNFMSKADFDDFVWPAHESYMRDNLAPLLNDARVVKLQSPTNTGHRDALVRRIMGIYKDLQCQLQGP